MMMTGRRAMMISEYQPVYDELLLPEEEEMLKTQTGFFFVCIYHNFFASL